MSDPKTPQILVLLPETLYRVLFTGEADTELRSLGQVTYNTDGQDWDSAALAASIGDHDIVVTGWGSPRFDDAAIEAARRLALAAHSAGSIRHLFPRRLFERGVRVTHAAAAIAPAVAEMSLTLLLMLLRQPHTMDRCLKAGQHWADCSTTCLGREVSGLRIGVVGAGYTGRCFIRMLKCLGADVWVYDPYLGEEPARSLDVRVVTLDDLMSECAAVSLQARATDETFHMIGARELSLLQDGAILVNTARSWLIDEHALVRELASGRILAALDVFDQEPLPEDHPFRTMSNVVVTPHTAGASMQARERQGMHMVEEIRRFLAGQPLRYEVTLGMLDTMA